MAVPAPASPRSHDMSLDVTGHRNLIGRALMRLECRRQKLDAEIARLKQLQAVRVS